MLAFPNGTAVDVSVLLMHVLRAEPPSLSILLEPLHSTETAFLAAAVFIADLLSALCSTLKVIHFH